MRMVVAVAIAALGGLVLAGGLSATADLRGWPSGSGAPPAEILRPARPGGPAFRIADCLSWTVDPNALPRSTEYQGVATETLVACRSRSSFATWLSVYGLAAASIGLVWMTRSRQNRRRAARSL